MASDFFTIKGVSTKSNESYHLLQFDGKAEPNPGHASGAAAIFYPILTREDIQLKSPHRRIMREIGEYLDYATNNQAEYRGLIVGLTEASAAGITEILIEGDSMLVVMQVSRRWQVKNAGLTQLWDTVQRLLQKFTYVAVRHIYRDNNSWSDCLTNEDVSTKGTIWRAS